MSDSYTVIKLLTTGEYKQSSKVKLLFLKNGFSQIVVSDMFK